MFPSNMCPQIISSNFKYFDCSRRPNTQPSKQDNLRLLMRRVDFAKSERSLDAATEEASSYLLDYFFEKCFELLDRLRGYH